MSKIRELIKSLGPLIRKTRSNSAELILSARMRRALSMTAYLAFWSLGDSEFSPSVLFICPQGKIISASQPSQQVWNSNIFSVLSVKYQTGTFGWVLTHISASAFFSNVLSTNPSCPQCWSVCSSSWTPSWESEGWGACTGC